MKTHPLPTIATWLLIAAALTLGITTRTTAQECMVAPPPPPTQFGGAYIPSGGGPGSPSPAVIYSLMLYIEFSDDDDGGAGPQGAWPKLTLPNLMMTDAIDLPASLIPRPMPGTPSGRKYNVTTYFSNMSFGRLIILGHPVYKVARYTLAQYQAPITAQAAQAAGHPGDAGRDFRTYLGGNVRYWAFRHAMEELDPTWSFVDFDHWSRPANYTHTNLPDTKLDLILVNWRSDGSYVRRDANGNPVLDANGIPIRDREASFAGFGGVADLGSGPSFPVDGGARTIDCGYPGSGVTTLSMKSYPRMDVVYHEIGHLLGIGHHYNGGLWTLMGDGHPNVSPFMNSQEREQLGWITITNVTNDGQTATISDFGTTGVAYRLNVGTGLDYLIENHQQIPLASIVLPNTTRPWYNALDIPTYDVVDRNVATPGIYVVQNNGGALDVVCADGRWSWAQAPCPGGSVTAPWSSTQKLTVWKRGAMNRTGGSTDRQFMGSGTVCYTNPAQAIPSDFIWAWKHPNTGTLINTGKPKHYGDGADAWTLDNKIFSPWSNPSTRGLDPNTNVGFEVTGTNGSNINVKFYTSNPQDGVPSAPQELKASFYSPNGTTTYARLNWTANIEPDVNPNGLYEIYKVSGATLTYLNSVAGNVTTYTDNSANLAIYSSGTVTYKIRAKDQQNKVSGYSELAVLSWGGQGGNGSKLNLGTGAHSGAFGAVQQPNPFSDRTSVVYQIPVEGMVTLSIFDMKGREVATLVDHVQPAGSHTAELDGSTLEPGTYVYRIQYAGETITGRMVLSR